MRSGCGGDSGRVWYGLDHTGVFREFGSHIHAHRDERTDGSPVADSQRFADSHGDADRDALADADRNAHGDADRDAHADADRNALAERDPGARPAAGLLPQLDAR